MELDGLSCAKHSEECRGTGSSQYKTRTADSVRVLIPQSVVRSPQSAVRSPQSAVRSPQSAVRSPQSIFYTDRTEYSQTKWRREEKGSCPSLIRIIASLILLNCFWTLKPLALQKQNQRLGGLSFFRINLSVNVSLQLIDEVCASATSVCLDYLPSPST